MKYVYTPPSASTLDEPNQINRAQASAQTANVSAVAYSIQPPWVYPPLASGIGPPLTQQSGAFQSNQPRQPHQHTKQSNASKQSPQAAQDARDFIFMDVFQEATSKKKSYSYTGHHHQQPDTIGCTWRAFFRSPSSGGTLHERSGAARRDPTLESQRERPVKRRNKELRRFLRIL